MKNKYLLNMKDIEQNIFESWTEQFKNDSNNKNFNNLLINDGSKILQRSCSESKTRL